VYIPSSEGESKNQSRAEWPKAYRRSLEYAISRRGLRGTVKAGPRQGEAALRKIILATHNQGKLREITALLGSANVELLSLNDYPEVPEIEEDGATFLENARKKACTVAALTGEAALADDSGLEVEWLGGAPGIYSARFAGPGATDAANIAKLLEALRGVPRARRGAAFRCVLVYCRPDGSWEHFTGTLQGEIAAAPTGSAGFGYDPVFYVPAYKCTVAQLAAEVKNRISHRGRAIAAFKLYLERELSYPHGA